MKETKAVPIWQNGIVLASLGTMLVFTSLVAVMDLETVLAWARDPKAQWDGPGILRNGSASNAPDEDDLKVRADTHDDPACLARSQHLLYRHDPERFAPSAAFTEAWDRYVEMHKSCTEKTHQIHHNWTNAFLAKDQGDEDDHQHECSYLIVMEGSGGLGNKLLSLTSAFAFAFATNRVVLVDGGDQFKHLLCDPFPDSSWFLPEGFPYNRVTSAEGLNIAIERNFKNMTMVLLRLDHVQTWADRQFFCDHTHSGLAKIRWVGWMSNQYYVTRLMMVPSLWATLNPLFNPEEIFTTLSHKVLLPTNHLWANIVRILVSYFPGSSKRVGIQVRLHGRRNLAEFDPNALDRILDCLQSREALPKLKQEESDVSDLMSFARNNYHSTSDISVLITSLQLRYYDELKDLYIGRPNVNNSVIRFHMVSHLGGQDRSVHQLEAAFVEMWLLSYSDQLAISAYSTFGYVPEGIGGVKDTWLLNIKGDLRSNDTESCSDGYSTQPCTHFPQHPNCGDISDANELHSEWMRHHVRECPDQPGGLQLVHEVEQPNPSAALWKN